MPNGDWHRTIAVGRYPTEGVRLVAEVRAPRRRPEGAGAGGGCWQQCRPQLSLTECGARHDAVLVWLASDLNDGKSDVADAALRGRCLQSAVAYSLRPRTRSNPLRNRYLMGAPGS